MIIIARCGADAPRPKTRGRGGGFASQDRFFRLGQGDPLYLLVLIRFFLGFIRFL